MRCFRQTQVFCGTAEPVVTGLLMFGDLVPLLPGFTIKALEPSLLDAPFCAFYSCKGPGAAGTNEPVRIREVPRYCRADNLDLVFARWAP